MNPYSYDLPPERIAQRPVHPPDAAKLLIIDRAGGQLSSGSFHELPRWLGAGDLLVFNDTRVLPARFTGTFEDNGGEAELLLVRRLEHGRWLCIGRPLRRFRPGRAIRLDRLLANVVRRAGEKEVEIRFETGPGEDPETVMKQAGSMPIPPYIRGGRGDEHDRIDYQTMFAREDGSIAAPTASLHFTPILMEQMATAGCNVGFLTLHVGTSSFLPLQLNERNEFSPPGEEIFLVPPELLSRMKRIREAGGRVIGVGTTVVRALESAVRGIEEKSTSLFITPGFEFMAVDGVITNFHQPGTTHLLLVEALLGRQLLAGAYEYALQNGYRFLSYGDGMLIL